MKTQESNMKSSDGAAQARLEKLRGLALIRDEVAPTRAAHSSRAVLVLAGILVVQTILFVGFAWYRYGVPAGTAKPVAAGANGAATGTAGKATGVEMVAARDGSVRLQAQGFIVAARQATVSTRVVGIVTKVPVKAGDRVERGQVVGVLNADLAEQDLKLAEKSLLSLRAIVTRERARQEQTEGDYQRELLLAQGNYTSRARLDEKKAASIVARTIVASSMAELDLGEARVQQQRSLLDNYTIRAPFSGIVVETNAQVGELVAPMSAGGSFARTGICTIVDMDSLMLVVDIGEQQIQHVKVGDTVSFRLYLDEQTQSKGVVQRILPSADRAKGTLQVQIAISGKDSRVVPGMRANVNFI